MERLAVGPVIGDGGFIFALEKRGFVKVRNWQKEIVARGKRTRWQKKVLIFFQAGPWTPEATVEHPDAVNYLFFPFLDFLHTDN